MIAFLLLLTLLILLFRNIVKLLADQRSRVLGSRIRSRMLVGALLLSFAPAVFMFLFSFGLLNRSMERWFSQPASQMRQDSTLVHRTLSICSRQCPGRGGIPGQLSQPELTRCRPESEALLREIGTHRITLEGGFVAVFRNGEVVGQYQLPRDNGKAIIRSWMDEAETMSPRATTLSRDRFARRPAQRRAHAGDGKNEYVLGAASTGDGCIVVAGLPLPPG